MSPEWVRVQGPGEAPNANPSLFANENEVCPDFAYLRADRGPGGPLALVAPEAPSKRWRGLPPTPPSLGRVSGARGAAQTPDIENDLNDDIVHAGLAGLAA